MDFFVTDSFSFLRGRNHILSVTGLLRLQGINMPQPLPINQNQLKTHISYILLNVVAFAAV